VRPAPGSPSTPIGRLRAAADSLRELSGDVDLLVIGSRRWGPMARLLLGGTGEALVHGATLLWRLAVVCAVSCAGAVIDGGRRVAQLGLGCERGFAAAGRGQQHHWLIDSNHVTALLAAYRGSGVRHGHRQDRSAEALN
jgi:hypothetical protein